MEGRRLVSASETTRFFFRVGVVTVSCVGGSGRGIMEVGSCTHLSSLEMRACAVTVGRPAFRPAPATGRAPVGTEAPATLGHETASPRMHAVAEATGPRGGLDAPRDLLVDPTRGAMATRPGAACRVIIGFERRPCCARESGRRWCRAGIRSKGERTMTNNLTGSNSCNWQLM